MAAEGSKLEAAAYHIPHSAIIPLHALRKPVKFRVKKAVKKLGSFQGHGGWDAGFVMIAYLALILCCRT